MLTRFKLLRHASDGGLAEPLAPYHPVGSKRAFEASRQVIESCAHLGWHQHDTGYASVVLEGCYIEAGDSGRRRVEPGDILIHAPFEAHANWFGNRRVVVANFPLRRSAALQLESGRLADARILRLDSSDPEGIELLLSQSIVPTRGELDLADQLAEALRHDPDTQLAQWAADRNVPARTLRRQFSKAYGISPLEFRARAKARLAFRLISSTANPLVQVSLDAHFSDQPHMSRAVRKLTGQSPSDWRRGRSVQD